MATVHLWTDAEVEASPEVKAVFDDIKAARKSDFINNFWRALANDPAARDTLVSCLLVWKRVSPGLEACPTDICDRVARAWRSQSDWWPSRRRSMS